MKQIVSPLGTNPSVSFPRKRESRSLVPPKSRSPGFAGAGLSTARAEAEMLDSRFCGNDNQSVSVAWPPASCFIRLKHVTGIRWSHSCLRRNDTLAALHSAKILPFGKERSGTWLPLRENLPPDPGFPGKLPKSHPKSSLTQTVNGNAGF